MKGNLVQQGIRLLITAGLMLVIIFTGCEKSGPGLDEQAATGPENIKAKITGGSDIVRMDCHYQPVLGSNGPTSNCHGFAWQCDYGVPTTAPNYAINSDEVCKFYNYACSAPYDPCFVGGSGEVGDKVVYSNDHSAVVYSTSPTRMFISYCMSYQKPRIHRPDDAAGIYAYDPKNNFGSVIGYYHYYTGTKGGVWPGNPISVIYANNFAVEMEGTKFTEYVVGNKTRAGQYYWWDVVPYPNNGSSSWSKKDKNVEYSTVDMQIMWNTWPNATELHIYMYLCNSNMVPQQHLNKTIYR